MSGLCMSSFFIRHQYDWYVIDDMKDSDSEDSYYEEEEEYFYEEEHTVGDEDDYEN